MFWRKRNLTVKLEFVGGPLDGYRQTLPGHPAEILAFPVNRNLLAALNGDEPPSTSPITSVAFYEGSSVGNAGWRFRFVGATTPQAAAAAGQTFQK